MTEQVWGIGVDLGGTKIAIAAVDQTGKILQRVRLNTEDERFQSEASRVIEQILQAARDLIRKIGSPPQGLGIGVAGQVDKKTGTVFYAPNLDWHDVPLQSILAKGLNIPVYVTNDVRAATWGEWLYGAGKGCQDFICIYVGTGIGSGIVSGGKMLTGCNNTAGEIGHTSINLNGHRCKCGGVGCLEAYAGGWAVAKRVQDVLQKEPSQSAFLLQRVKGKIESITAKDIAEGAKAGDPFCVEIIDDVTHALICGVANAVNFLSPCKVILGGGMITGMPELVQKIDYGVKERALKAATHSLEILISHCVEDAAVIGAASIPFQSKENKK